MAYFAGIDIGTSTLKVLIVDEKGQTKALGQVAYPVKFIKTGYAEQSPKDWTDALDKALSIVKDKCDLSKVVAIGFSGQMHGMVAIDEDGNPLRNAIIWMDQRTGAESIEIQEILGEDFIKEELLNKPAAGILLSSLYWLKKYEIDNYKKTYKLLSPKDYLRFYLSGEFCTDESDASATLAFSIKSRKWSEGVLDKLSLDSKLFADVKKSSDFAGKMKKDLASKFGFNEDVYISAGGGDSAMQLVGNGIVNTGKLALNIGTASQIVSVVDKPIFDEKMRLQTWCHSAPEKWYVQGGALTGGVALKWFKENVLNTDIAYRDMDKFASESTAGSDGLLFLPYLSGSRTPNMNPDARGVFFGLSIKHTYKDMTRSIMEGVVYNLKQSYDILVDMGISSDRLIASGGGANGRTWKQIQADVFNMPVYSTSSEEEACLGAAILAAVGQGYFATVEEACSEMVGIKDEVVYPIADNHMRYKEMQEIFVDLYKKNEKLF